MSRFISAEPPPVFQGDRQSMWLTTAQVAERLQISTGFVRRLARQGEIAHLVTGDGQRLFRREDIWRYREARSDQREQRRPTQLAALRPRMVFSALQPRQMSLLPLLLSPRLRMVKVGESSVPHAEVKAPGSPVKSSGSDSCDYVNRKAAVRCR